MNKYATCVNCRHSEYREEGNYYTYDVLHCKLTDKEAFGQEVCRLWKSNNHEPIKIDIDAILNPPPFVPVIGTVTDIED